MILVTGGSGLVGRELISQLLSQGKNVTAIYNKTPLTDFNGDNQLKQIHCDILDVITLEEVMQNIDEVYHCAAIVTFNHKRKQELFKVNIEGTANVVNAALDAGVKKLVHVSSVARIREKIHKVKIVNENIGLDRRCQRKSSYAKSKYLSEMEVWRGISEGLNAAIINPSTILGAGDWNVGSTKIFQTVYKEFPWYSEGVNGFVDVRDVAKAMIQLMESDVSGERFIVSAADKSYKDIFDLIAKGFVKKQPHKKVTPFIAQLVLEFGSSEKHVFLRAMQDPLVTKETAATALNHIHFDNSKLQKYFPWVSNTGQLNKQ